MNAVVDSLWESCYIKMSGVPSDLDSLSRILLDGPGWGRGQDSGGTFLLGGVFGPFRVLSEESCLD